MIVSGVSRGPATQPVRDMQAAAFAAQAAAIARADRIVAAVSATSPEVMTIPGVPPGSDGTKVDLYA